MYLNTKNKKNMIIQEIRNKEQELKELCEAYLMPVASPVNSEEDSLYGISEVVPGGYVVDYGGLVPMSSLELNQLILLCEELRNVREEMTTYNPNKYTDQNWGIVDEFLSSEGEELTNLVIYPDTLTESEYSDDECEGTPMKVFVSFTHAGNNEALWLHAYGLDNHYANKPLNFDYIFKIS